MRIGFLVWNEFQFYHFRAILEARPTSTLFIDMRFGWHRHFPAGVLVGLKNPIIWLQNSKLNQISSMVDVLVVQSNTKAKSQLPNVKIVAMQYSLSKEWHQYGKWMQEADLVLCFGEYSRNKIANHPAVVATGNPRMDDYFAGRLDDDRLSELRATLDPSKPTIMLAPSWNDNTSITRLKSARPILAKKYNVIWSPHHNTRIFQNIFQRIFMRPRVNVDAFLYSLSLADILISDTSGALFDAIHAGKHALIVDFSTNNESSLDSIEFTQRHMIGPVARNIDEIAEMSERLISGQLDFKLKHSELRAHCFCCNGGAAPRIITAIEKQFATDGT